MADQIRQLAEESANSAVESKKLIEESMNEVGVGNRVTRETNEAMQKVMTELDQIIQEVANIRTASDRQAVSVSNIKKGVEDINDVIQSNSAAAEETSCDQRGAFRFRYYFERGVRALQTARLIGGCFSQDRNRENRRTIAETTAVGSTFISEFSQE